MIKTILHLLLVAGVAFASNPDPSNTFKFGDGTAVNKSLIFNRVQGGLNPTIRWNETGQQLEFSTDGINYSGIGSGSGGGSSGINLITTNPDFENGIALGWTNTGGAFLPVSSGSNLLFGKGSATFQAFSVNQSVQTSLYLIPIGLQGQACQVNTTYKGGDGNINLYVLDQSDAIIAQVAMPASTNPTNAIATFTCPASGSLRFQLKSTSAMSSAIAFDRNYMGENTSLIQLSQAQLVGNLHYPGTASCDWTATTSGAGTWVDFGVGSSCPVATATGNIQPPATKIPGFQAALTPGDYIMLVTGSFWNGVNGDVGWARMTNGLDVSLDNPTIFSPAVPSAILNGNAIFHMVVTDGTLRTYKMQSAGTSGGITQIGADTGEGNDFNITIIRMPSGPELALRPNQVANSWSGYHTANCTWGQGGTSYADITTGDSSGCTLVQRTNTNFGVVTSTDDGTPGNTTPGIIFTPTRVGKYYVCANPIVFSGTAAAQSSYRLVDGDGFVVSEIGKFDQTIIFEHNVQICGLYQATSIAPKTLKIQVKATSGSANIDGNANQSAVEWSIFQVDQNLPAPIVIAGPRSEWWVTTGVAQACGSTNVYTRYFSTVKRNTGQDITGVCTTALGCIATVNTAGVYCMTLNDACGDAGGCNMGIIRGGGDILQGNSATANNDYRLVFGLSSTSASSHAVYSVCTYLAAGETVHPQSDVVQKGDVQDAIVGFRVVKVSN